MEPKHFKRTGQKSNMRLCAGGCGKWITDYKCEECWIRDQGFSPRTKEDPVFSDCTQTKSSSARSRPE